MKYKEENIMLGAVLFLVIFFAFAVVITAVQYKVRKKAVEKEKMAAKEEKYSYRA